MLIRISTSFPAWPLVRQTPGGRGFWGDHQFVVDQPVEACDWWVVIDGLERPETARCSRENTLLITGEPPAIKSYDRRFTKQFAHVVTCHRRLRHTAKRLTQQALPWHIGVVRGERGETAAHFLYDDFTEPVAMEKREAISVIVSDKAITRGHRHRLKLIEKLTQHFGETLEVYGRGFQEVDDKWDVIAPVRYHLVLENSRVPHYFTEKLSDAFLGGAFPVYSGCPNLEEYFPSSSYLAVDSSDIRGTIRSIEALLSGQVEFRALEALDSARRLVLDHYNLFPMLVDFIRSKPLGQPRELTLQPQGIPAP